jgi:hypothetical protein
MKTLAIEKIIKELDELTAIKIDPTFLNRKDIDAPILKQLDLLLNAVGEKGLKLTPKGNLPTKVVKEITLCCPAESNEAILEFTNRYLEDEQVSVQRARVVAEVGKLVKVSKGKMHYGTMAEAYRSASKAEKFIYLVWQFSKVNLAYFDRMQEASLLNGISFILLQVVRDRPEMFREVKVYSAFLMDGFPQLADAVEEEIKTESLFKNDPFEKFEDMMELRLFKNFFLPFGLVKERGVYWEENYECCKTALLENFLLPLNEVNESIVLNKKELRLFAQRIKKEKLDIQLFSDFCFIYAHAARYPLKPVALIVEDLIRAKKVIGTAAKAQKTFYTDFANATEQTLKYFTQLEVKGGGSRGDDMTKNFTSLIDGLYALLPNDKPHNMMIAMRSVSYYFIDMLVTVYKVDVASSQLEKLLRENFSEETIEDIGAVLFTAGEIEKKTKKFKRINTNMETMGKECLTSFILAVMSIHTYEMDKA